MTRALLFVMLAASPLSAQTDAELQQAASSITAADMSRHVGVIAHDSMLGRDTPSLGLELTAQYVADQFKALGLEPVAAHGSWLQRYPIPKTSRMDYETSPVWFTSPVQKKSTPRAGDEDEDKFFNFAAVTSFAVDTVLHGTAPASRSGGQAAVAGFSTWVGPRAILMAGPHTVESARQANLRDRVVIYVPPAGLDSTHRQQVISLLQLSNHVMVLTDEDSASFARRRQAALRHPPVIIDPYLPEARQVRRWVIYVWPDPVKDKLASGGLDLSQARASATPVVRELSARVAVRPLAKANGEANGEMTLPNTIGILQGSDPNLRGQTVVISAHMDHVGIRRGQADSIANGADDNASGVAGLIALAKAFSQPGARPRRSITFVAVSGGTKELWGSKALAHSSLRSLRRRVVANINLDMIGRSAGDSVRVSGIQEVELPIRPEWLAAQHPELGLTVVDSGTVTTPESDHFAFVQKAVPSLYFFNGTHDEPAGRPDAPDAIDAEQAARITRLAFYVGHSIANAPRALGWTPAGRRHRRQLSE